jgi:hypothetical protein
VISDLIRQWKIEENPNCILWWNQQVGIGMRWKEEWN